jgi:hypothetical protein
MPDMRGESLGDLQIGNAECCQWLYGGGKNDKHKHKSFTQEDSYRLRLEEIAKISSEIKSNRRIDYGVTLAELDKERRHINKKLREPGENHSRRPKGH